MSPTSNKESVVVGWTAERNEVRGTLLRLTRHLVTFEVYATNGFLKTSEVLSEFAISLGNRTVYSGRAVVRNLIPTNLVLICEATLEDQWLDTDLLSPSAALENPPDAFQRFLRDWQHVYKVDAGFKVVVADLHSFLTDMRLWLEQVEMGIRSSPADKHLQLEHEIAAKLGTFTSPALDNIFDRLEQLSRKIEPDLQPTHRVFCRRQLHPLLLCSPFLHRTFYKPLGYAGDYEMVNMVIRDPLEGSSLFAKLVNLWFLQQAPAEAHRDRIAYLLDRLKEVTAKAVSEGRAARILSLGCGPAWEVQRFLAEQHFSDHAQFTLLDFNEETIKHTAGILEEVKRRHHRRTLIDLQKKAVTHILKEAGKSGERSAAGQFDFVYCAGLYDYLTDQVCRRVSGALYDWTAPGGLFVATNVDVSNPRRSIMDFVMEWHLIYRDARQLKAVRPGGTTEDQSTVKSDITGVNLFLEVRKPERE